MSISSSPIGLGKSAPGRTVLTSIALASSRTFTGIRTNVATPAGGSVAKAYSRVKPAPGMLRMLGAARRE